MIYQITWTHPSQRRFVTRLGVNGDRLTQEVAGVQLQETRMMCATQAEYATLVRAQETSDYTNDLNVQAEEIIHPGIERFAVTVTGSRPMAPAITDDGAYVYEAK